MIYPDVDKLSRDTKSEFTITEWPQGRAQCAAPSALLLLCFPPKPELATVQWDNQIGDPNFKIRDPLKWGGILDPTSFWFTITNLEQRWKPKLSWMLNMNSKIILYALEPFLVQIWSPNFKDFLNKGFAKAILHQRIPAFIRIYIYLPKLNPK